MLSPNVVRTIAQISNYMYSTGKDGLYINMYGGNNLQTVLTDGSKLALQQVSNYPWDGAVSLLITEAPATTLPVHLRIPGWCNKASVKVNGKLVNGAINGGQYFTLNQKWKKEIKSNWYWTCRLL
ncbi:glycoside hydrolase family 127 protein [Niabella sp. W65]|nr:glycoside hydrolase family 127 protein [Niabella sp. W65]MCH7365523.1 glycoside hydrolase family 127 protein [Niabella sp. W65]ULT41306.1 glycoside hydrolase family 127 protein [Niabella sp. I65]